MVGTALRAFAPPTVLAQLYAHYCISGLDH
jgi:hypothetical protein